MSLPNIWYISMIMTEKHTNIITFEQEWTNFMKTKWGTKCFKPSACNLINCQIQDINCIDQCFKFQDGYLFSQLSQQQQHQQQHQQQQQQQQQQLLLLLILLAAAEYNDKPYQLLRYNDPTSRNSSRIYWQTPSIASNKCPPQKPPRGSSGSQNIGSM